MEQRRRRAMRRGMSRRTGHALTPAERDAAQRALDYDLIWYHHPAYDHQLTRPRSFWFDNRLLDGKQGLGKHEAAFFAWHGYAGWRIARQLDWIAHHGLIFAHNARELARWQREREANREAATRANYGLLVMLAKRIQTTESIDDKVQEGSLGLMAAIDRFDPSRGFRFATYAGRAIWQHMARSGTKAGRWESRNIQGFEGGEDHEQGGSQPEEQHEVADLIDFVTANRAELSPLQLRIIAARFPLDGSKPARHEELAQREGKATAYIRRQEKNGLEILEDALK